MGLRLLTAQDVAVRFQVPVSWIYTAARNGDLPSVSLGRYRRFHPDDLAEWEQRQRQRTGRRP